MKKQKEFTWAEIKAMYAETDRRFKETDKRFKETERQFKENERKLNEMFEKTNRQIGGISRSNGEFCEEYFINSFKENSTFMGEKYDRAIDYLKPDPAVIYDEYDLVLRNGSSIVLIEMKYKAGTDDVGKMFSKLHTYRANYPMFKDYKIYLCLASFRFPLKVRERAEKDGITLIQQRGDKIEVISKNVKAW